VSYPLAATRPHGGKIQSFLSDNRISFSVLLEGPLSFTVDGVDDTFTLDKDWIPYNGRCLGGKNRILAVQRGEEFFAIFKQLASYFVHRGADLSEYRLSVSSQRITLRSPMALSDTDCKTVFAAAASQFPSQLKPAAA